MDLSSWRVLFPEFARTPDARVLAFLSQAALLCDRDAYGDQYEAAVGWLAADMIARSPYAQQSQTTANAKPSTYYRDTYETLMLIAAAGPRVL